MWPQCISLIIELIETLINLPNMYLVKKKKPNIFRLAIEDRRLDMPRD